MRLTDDIIAYEAGELGDDEIVALFQRLIDSGLVWQLQGPLRANGSGFNRCRILSSEKMKGMTRMINYTPKPEDIAFARMITTLISNGGSWGAPADGLVYTFDKPNKTMTLTNPEQLKSQGSLITHERAKAVFDKIGWKVEDGNGQAV